MKDKKIDFLITGMDYGGAETQVKALALALKKRGWPVRVITLMQPVAFMEEFRQADIPLVSLGIKRGDFLALPMALWYLIKLLRTNETVVLHSHMVHANLLARLVKFFYPVLKVLITTAHNKYEGGRLIDLFYRYTDFLAHITTNVSEEATQRYIDDKLTPAKKIRCFYNGIDTERFSLTTQRQINTPFTWLAVGRFDTQKDYSNLFLALTKLMQPFRLQVIGRGPLLAELQAQVLALGLADNVHFLGVCNDVERVMRQADAFVLSSAWEGFGLVVAEALACELPVVATDCGGPAEIVGKDKKAGFVVPPKNADALAMAMNEMMSLSQEQRVAMGKYGRECMITRFGLANIVTQWECLYTELMEQNSD